MKDSCQSGHERRPSISEHAGTKSPEKPRSWSMSNSPCTFARGHGGSVLFLGFWGGFHWKVSFLDPAIKTATLKTANLQKNPKTRVVSLSWFRTLRTGKEPEQRSASSTVQLWRDLISEFCRSWRQRHHNQLKLLRHRPPGCPGSPTPAGRTGLRI